MASRTPLEENRRVTELKCNNFRNETGMTKKREVGGHPLPPSLPSPGYKKDMYKPNIDIGYASLLPDRLQTKLVKLVKSFLSVRFTIFCN